MLKHIKNPLLQSYEEALLFLRSSDPDILASEIIKKLEAGLESFREIMDTIGKELALHKAIFRSLLNKGRLFLFQDETQFSFQPIPAPLA